MLDLNELKINNINVFKILISHEYVSYFYKRKIL